MERYFLLSLFVCNLWALIMPKEIDKAKVDDGTGFCDKHVPVMTTREIVVADSSLGQYTMWTQMQECLAYNPELGYLEFTCRNFLVGSNLNVWQTDNTFSMFVTDENVYTMALGPARYPTSVASDDGSGNGPHISFPYFIGFAWGGMGGQYESGGWFSSFWDDAVDVGQGNLGTHKNIGKQLPNGNILFIGVTTTNEILCRVWSADLGTFIGGDVLAPETVYYWGFDINGGIACVFYYDASLNVYYRTSTDGINWTPQQTYNLVWPNPFTNNVLYWCQMALTSAGNPVLVFDIINGDDTDYPYEGKVYVSTAPGQPCIEVGVTTSGEENFYPTIATGGDYVVVLFQVARSGTDSLTFWDLYYNYSVDNGATWSIPRNLTSGITDRNHCLPQIAKRLDPEGTGQFFFVFGVRISAPLQDLLYHAYISGTPYPSRWYVGRNPIVGIAENKTETPRKLTLNITPNPVRNQTGISYTLPNSGNVSINLYGVDGRLVKLIEQGYKDAGIYEIGLNAYELPQGAYIILLKTAKDIISRKIVITR